MFYSLLYISRMTLKVCHKADGSMKELIIQIFRCGHFNCHAIAFLFVHHYSSQATDKGAYGAWTFDLSELTVSFVLFNDFNCFPSSTSVLEKAAFESHSHKDNVEELPYDATVSCEFFSADRATIRCFLCTILTCDVSVETQGELLWSG